MLFSIFRLMWACCASSAFLACCVFCVLDVCAVRSGHCVRAVCVCCALCVGPAVHHSATPSRTYLLFLQFTQKLPPRMRIRYISVSFFVPFFVPRDLIIQYPSHFHFIFTTSAGRRVRMSSPGFFPRRQRRNFGASKYRRADKCRDFPRLGHGIK